MFKYLYLLIPISQIPQYPISRFIRDGRILCSFFFWFGIASRAWNIVAHNHGQWALYILPFSTENWPLPLLVGFFAASQFLCHLQNRLSHGYGKKKRKETIDHHVVPQRIIYVYLSISFTLTKAKPLLCNVVQMLYVF